MKCFFAQSALAIFLMGMILGCGKSVDAKLSMQLILTGCNRDDTADKTWINDITTYCVTAFYTESGAVVKKGPLCANTIDKAQLPVTVKDVLDAPVQVVIEGYTNQEIKARGVSTPVKLDATKDTVISVPFFRFVNLPSSATSWAGGEFLQIAGTKAANGSTTTCNDLPYPAQNHTATVFNSGHVLVVGTSQALNTNTPDVAAFLIDTYTNDESKRFSLISNTRNLLHRYGHTASLLSDGRVVILGGVLSYCDCSPQPCICAPVPQKDVIVIDGTQMNQPYDLGQTYASPSVTKLASTTAGYSGHDAAVLQGGQILVNDGKNPPVLFSGDGLNLSPTTITITSSSDGNPFPTPGSTATVLPTELANFSVLYGGAASPLKVGLLQQDSTVSTNFTFKTFLAATPTSRAHPLGVKLLSGPGTLFFGGLPANSSDPQVIYVAKEPSPISCPQKNRSDFPTEGYTVTRLSNNYIFVAGGISTQTTSTFVPGSTFYLVPNSDLSTCSANGNFTIYNGPPMLMPRKGHTASLLPDGRLLLIGGQNAKTNASDPAVANSAEVIALDQTQ